MAANQTELYRRRRFRRSPIH